MGYHLAGFDVVGVDIEPQPNYPFKFIRGDALEYLAECGGCYDAIAASPPCQAFSRVQSLGAARNGSYPVHADLIEPTRLLLEDWGKPYVIENVEGAPLHNPAMLCGSMFPSLRVYRHRLFETNWLLMTPPHSPHRDTTPPAGNGLSPKGYISVCGSGGVKGMNSAQILKTWQEAMDIDWMNRRELAQAIPPAYTFFIGSQLIDCL